MRRAIPHKISRLVLRLIIALALIVPPGAAIVPQASAQGLPGPALTGLGALELGDRLSGVTLAQSRSDPISSFFKSLFGGLKRKTQPKRKTIPLNKSRSSSGTPRSLGSGQRQVKAAEKAEDAKRVVVFGDFFAGGLAKGLTEAFLESSSIIVEGQSDPSSGLVRDDHYNWPAGMAGRLLDPEKKVDLAVVMLGANDRQQLSDEAGKHDPRSERWRELYSERIDEIIKVFTDRDVPLYLVSLPPVASGRMSQDYAYFNDIYRERAYRYGVEFVDLWNSFVDEAGNYAASGPDVNGEHKQLRAEDGLNFTKAGNRKLAHFVAREIRRDFGREGGLFLALPQGPSGPQPFMPSDDQLRSGIGEVTALTGARGGSGSALAGGPKPTPDAPRDSAYYQVILEGEVPEATAGRADDFSWPRKPTALSRATPPRPVIVPDPESGELPPTDATDAAGSPAT